MSLASNGEILIQRTIFPSRFGRDKSHSFPVPYIKPYKRVVFSLLHNCSGFPAHSSIQIHKDCQITSIISSKNFKNPFEDFKDYILI